MYQICTNTTATGYERSATDTRKVAVTCANDDLPGPLRMTVNGLITRRSQVQILPPPPSARKRRSEALSETSERAFVVLVSTFGFDGRWF